VVKGERKGHCWGWISVGLESYIDSNCLTIYFRIRKVKMTNSSKVNSVLEGTN